VRQAAQLNTIAKASADQLRLSELLTQDVEEARARARDISGLSAKQSRLSATSAQDLKTASAQLASWGKASTEHSEALSRVSSLVSEKPFNGEPNGRKTSHA
jgi:hypothetical protein